MSYSRGDVVLVSFPNADKITYKKRPVLIVQSDKLITTYGDKLVVCITSKLNKTGSTRIPISYNSEDGNKMGLSIDSMIIVDNIATMSPKEIIRKIGTCSVDVQQGIDAALRETFDL